MSSDVQEGREAVRSVEKEQYWRAQVHGHASSGLSVRAWCRQERVSEPSFYAWRRELAQRDQAGSAAVSGAGDASPTASRRRTRRVTPPAVRPAFLPVTVAEPSQRHIVLELPGGVVIRVPVDEADALRSVWRLLQEERPC